MSKRTNKTIKKIEAKTEFGKALSDLLFVFQTTEAAARKQFPNASDEKIYQIVEGAAKYGMAL
jgi:hypothetical protein